MNMYMYSILVYHFVNTYIYLRYLTLTYPAFQSSLVLDLDLDLGWKRNFFGLSI